MSNIEYKFVREECWYLNSCKLANTEQCCNGCLRHLEMFYLMKQSGLPKDLQKIHSLSPETVDIQAFTMVRNIKENIKEFVTSGKNLLIRSDGFGNGKTVWSVKLLQSYFDNIWFGNQYCVRGLFIDVPAYMLNIRNNINYPTNEFNRLRKNILKADVVIWDDIGSSYLKDYDYINLLVPINARVNNNLSNIYTTNLNKESAIKVLGSKLFSRVWTSSTVVEFKGLDRRGSNDTK